MTFFPTKQPLTRWPFPRGPVLPKRDGPAPAPGSKADLDARLGALLESPRARVLTQAPSLGEDAVRVFGKVRQSRGLFEPEPFPWRGRGLFSTAEYVLSGGKVYAKVELLTFGPPGINPLAPPPEPSRRTIWLELPPASPGLQQLFRDWAMDGKVVDPVPSPLRRDVFVA